MVSELGLRGFLGVFLWIFFAKVKGIFSPRTCKFLFEVYFFLNDN